MRVGLCGLGWAARSFHFPALRLVRRVEVVGGFDSSAEQRASWQRETGTRAFESLDELVATARPDVVVIGTPPDSHAELCLAALAHGAHVFCEKPFVSTVAEADRVLDAASAAGRQVAVNHEFREIPIFKAVKEQIDGGEFGRIVFSQIWQLMDLAPWDEPVSWRAAMPNRTLFEGGVHLVDLLVHLEGTLPSAVYARHSSGVRRDQNADAIHLVTLEFPDGRLAQLTIDRLCPSGTRYVEIRVDCERASLRASHGGRALIQIGKKRAEKTGIRVDYGSGGLAWAEQGLRRRPLARNPRHAAMRATGALLDKMVSAVEEGREPPSSGREARDVLTVIEAAYRSARDGTRVQIQPARLVSSEAAG